MAETETHLHEHSRRDPGELPQVEEGALRGNRLGNGGGARHQDS